MSSAASSALDSIPLTFRVDLPAVDAPSSYNNGNVASNSALQSHSSATPTITFSIPSSHILSQDISPYTRLTRAVDTLSHEQHLTSSQSESIVYLVQEMKKEVEEERLKVEWTMLRGKEEEIRMRSSSNYHHRQPRHSSSDSIGHYDEEESKSSTSAANAAKSTPPVAAATSMLDAWKKLVAKPSTSAKSVVKLAPSLLRHQQQDVDTLPSLLSSLIHAALREARLSQLQQQGNSSPPIISTTSLLTTISSLPDSPFLSLYTLLRSHASHYTIELLSQQKKFDELREEQSKEMEEVCSRGGVEEEMDESEKKENGDSSAAAAATSSTSLSDAISSLVHSHLLASSTLELACDIHLRYFLSHQRAQLRTFISQLVNEYLDRTGRRTEAKQSYEQDLQKKQEELKRKKRAKIMKTEDEEEEEREEAERARRKEEEERTEKVARGIRAYESFEMMMKAVEEGVPNEMAMLTDSYTHQTKKSSNGTAAVSSTTTAVVASTSSTAVPVPSFPSSPPLASPHPFPLHTLLSSHTLFLGSLTRPVRPLQVVMTNDTMFVPFNAQGSKDVVGPQKSNGSITARTTALASIPIASSPLISLPHFVQHLSSVYGDTSSSTGLNALILPHHISPLVHASSTSSHELDLFDDVPQEERHALEVETIRQRLSSTASTSSSTTPFHALRRQRELSLHYYNISNIYVKSWLNYLRQTAEWGELEFRQQLEEVVREMKERKARRGKVATAVTESKENGTSSADTATPSSNLSPSSSRDDLVSSSSNDNTDSSVSSILTNGDVVITRHSHLLNAQLCFHVNLNARKGGASAASAGNVGDLGASSSSSLPSQHHLFPTILSHILSLTTSHNIRTLTLPLIWDNVLLSMWTISGSYIGFGWKEAEEKLIRRENGGDGSDVTMNAGASSVLNSPAAKRAEEYGVYECTVRYIESHLRLIKQCLIERPNDSPLEHIILYLPPSSGSGTTTTTSTIQQQHHQQQQQQQTIQLEHTSTLHENGGSSSSSNGAIFNASLGTSAGASSHPFLAKCQSLFREVFQ